jgi:hypothetical protein
MTQRRNSNGMNDDRNKDQKEKREVRSLLAVVSLLGVSLGVSTAAPVDQNVQSEKHSTTLDGLPRVAKSQSNQHKATTSNQLKGTTSNQHKTSNQLKGTTSNQLKGTMQKQ